jgi:segregation and condensation protein B
MNQQTATDETTEPAEEPGEARAPETPSGAEAPETELAEDDAVDGEGGDEDAVDEDAVDEDAGDRAAPGDDEPEPDAPAQAPRSFGPDAPQDLRIVEAILFASAEPVPEEQLARHLPKGTDVKALVAQLTDQYAERGINLSAVAGGWTFRTAPDLAAKLGGTVQVTRKPSRAAVETLAIIAYHQPVTRAEIEEIRGVVISKGTLDLLLEAGWIRPKGRRQTPGRPLTYVTTEAFLSHFGLESLDALPGVDELRAAGLLDRRAGLATIAMRPEEAADAEAREAEAEAAAAAEELAPPRAEGDAAAGNGPEGDDAGPADR